MSGSRGSLRAQSGFTLIELLVVVAILGVLAAVAILNVGTFIGAGEDEALLAEQHNVQTAVLAYLMDGNRITAEFLVCPGSKGVLSPYLLGDLKRCYLIDIDGRAAVASGQPPPLTALGSTFGEISTSMIDLALEYYAMYGKWPRSWGDFRYSDLGLDPAEWSGVAVAGVLYAPVGDRLQVKPAEGYAFVFKYTDGSNGTLTTSLDWNLIYSLRDETWYFHTISEDNAIDISSLEIVAT
jgi:prepilin-type N-terminal cleavage/methylation domain-containing protein